MPSRHSVSPADLALIILIVIQFVCATFFVFDAINDFANLGIRATLDLHQIVEFVAVAAMLVAVVVEARALRRMRSQTDEAEKGIRVASGALHDKMEAYFRDWRLTPAEADVALFTIKGCDIAEIAQIRGSAEGTIKAHLNGIYRKAGVTGRSALISLLIDDLMGHPLVRNGNLAQPQPTQVRAS